MGNCSSPMALGSPCRGHPPLENGEKRMEQIRFNSRLDFQKLRSLIRELYLRSQIR